APLGPGSNPSAQTGDRPNPGPTLWLMGDGLGPAGQFVGGALSSFPRFIVVIGAFGEGLTPPKLHATRSSASAIHTNRFVTSGPATAQTAAVRNSPALCKSGGLDLVQLEAAMQRSHSILQ